MRNENCDRKPKCDDYKHNHCDGCGGNKPQGDLISREALNKIWELYKKYQPRLATNVYEFGVALREEIDNAPTVEEVSIIEFKEPLPPVKAQKIIRALNKRSQGDITEEDIQNAIKAGYENGYSMAQAKFQRPQGKWLIMALYGRNCYECDNCHLHYDFISNFCPNCGAEMVGGES